MKLSRVLGGCTNIIHGKEFPVNSIILNLDNGITFVCSNFRQPRNKRLQAYCYIPKDKKWVVTFLDENTKNIMWDYYRKCKRKQSRSNIDYAQLMKHDRKKKKGSGSKSSSNHAITDYECTKNPMHDFRRVYI